MSEEKVKHTPGEWEVDNAPAADGYDVNTNGDRWKHIATAKANSDGAAEVSDDEALANAYLMAAAPDLLAAAMAAGAILRTMPDDGRAEAVLSMVVAAVAKARGEGT